MSKVLRRLSRLYINVSVENTIYFLDGVRPKLPNRERTSINSKD